jgi:hypothetical protein
VSLADREPVVPIEQALLPPVVPGDELLAASFGEEVLLELRCRPTTIPELSQ